MSEPESKPRRRRSRFRRVAIAAVVGSSLGYLCALLPPDYQLYCTLVAKIISLIGGAS